MFDSNIISSQDSFDWILNDMVESIWIETSYQDRLTLPFLLSFEFENPSYISLWTNT